MTPSVFRKDLVLIGGGHAHVQVLKKFGMEGPPPGVRLTLVSDSGVAYYSGMLPGCIAGLYTPPDIRMELRPITRWVGARFIQSSVTDLDPRSGLVMFDDRPPLPFDALSINIGSISRGMDVPGVREYAVSTRPIGRLLCRIDDFERRYYRTDGPPQVVVVGGGAAGVELAFAMKTRWTNRFGQVDITLVDAGPEVLQGHGQRVQKVTLRYLNEKNIQIVQNVKADHVEASQLHLSDGRSVAFDLLLWASGGAAPPVLARSELETDQDGFLKVLPTLQTLSFPNIFAAGDCIHFHKTPLPKAGVYAVREGPALAENIKAFFSGTPLEPYHPQRRVLALLMTGDHRAIASWRGFAAHGRRVWSIKDWIDRRWMEKFNPAGFPVMAKSGDPSPTDVPEEDAMRCGGCGAKVGSTILTAALASLKVKPNPRVQIGLDQSDDAAVVEIPVGKRLVQTVDYFRAFIDDPYLFGRIAVMHAASDLFAMGAVPDTALVIATLPYASKSLVAGDLMMIMEGIVEETNRIGATVTGGHTSEGAELSVGVVMNGLVDPDLQFTKGGLETGDYLILTKPLGTGMILAADMRLRSRDDWMDTTINTMLQSNGPGADILSAAGVRSVTDVTGFGLGGHLMEMLEASESGAELYMNRLPLLPGVGQCMEEEIFSTLAPANREHLEKRWNLSMDVGVEDDILYDPQTSGGLLAGVKPNAVEAVLRLFQTAGYIHTAVIGLVTGKRRVLHLLKET